MLFCLFFVFFFQKIFLYFNFTFSFSSIVLDLLDYYFQIDFLKVAFKNFFFKYYSLGAGLSSGVETFTFIGLLQIERISL